MTPVPPTKVKQDSLRYKLVKEEGSDNSLESLKGFLKWGFKMIREIPPGESITWPGDKRLALLIAIHFEADSASRLYVLR